MLKLKIHILYNFKDGPWGGGNQFLKALRNELINKNYYTDNIELADIILFNSYPFGNESFFRNINNIKKRKKVIVIHRVDGPIYKIRNTDFDIDKIIFYFNNLVSDGTIFQSNWSREQCYSLSMQRNKFEEVIINAPNPEIFYPNKDKKINEKFKIIATSWSSNWLKGFDIYKYLDDNLDFNKYEMTFIGNSPIEFKNIKHILPVESNKLANLLRDSDIFITASKNDPCSNSLIEALHCGLPAVVRKSGGHPEIVKNAGCTFEGEKDVINAIENISSNYFDFRSKISLPNIDKVAESYYNFSKMIYEKVDEGKYKPKEFSFKNYQIIKFKIKLWHLKKFIGLNH